MTHPQAAPDRASDGSQPSTGSLSYAQTGVDIDAGERMARLIQSAVRRTHGPRVLDRPGSFAGLFRLDFNEQLFRRNYRHPVLVACTDGVGTKIKIAAAMNCHSTIGIDCVAMSANDLIVEGAEPLFFLDYLGTHKLDPQWAAEIVKGVAAGCRLANCALLGGETAEMPDLYAPDDYDLAGFCVGVVELDRAIDNSRVEVGDTIIGLSSSGIHSNGYTLVRRIVDLAKLDLAVVYPELGDQRTLGEVLLTPTRVYSRAIVRLLRRYKVKKIVSGMAHITGGGLPGNVCRALPDDVDAVIDRSQWDVPPVFRFLQRHGDVPEEEMWRVFNMGIGYVLIVRPTFGNSVMAQLRRMRETPIELGRIVPGTGGVRLEARI